MAWRLQQTASETTEAVNFTDQEMAAVFLSVRDCARSPFDESNPLFCAYLKLADV